MSQFCVSSNLAVWKESMTYNREHDLAANRKILYLLEIKSEAASSCSGIKA
jgi:hypothetical protein